MKQKDLIIFYPLKCEDKFVPMAYSFLGTVSAFSDAKDAFNVIKKSFTSEDECQKMCDKMNNDQNYNDVK